MMIRVCLAAFLLVLSLPLASRAQGGAAAATPAAAWTPASLAALIGKDVPKSIAAWPDINPEDRYAVGIDVFSGPIILQTGSESIPATLEVYTRELNVGAVRVLATVQAKDPQKVYLDVRQQLLASRVAADGDPELGDDRSSWKFVDAGTVEVVRGVAGAGLSFFAETTGMAASYAEFWKNFNAGK